jgi:hypothetical protein
LPWEEIFEITYGVKSGSSLAVDAGNGARHRMSFLGALGLIEEVESPCGGRSFKR